MRMDEWMLLLDFTGTIEFTARSRRSSDQTTSCLTRDLALDRLDANRGKASNLSLKGTLDLKNASFSPKADLSFSEWRRLYAPFGVAACELVVMIVFVLIASEFCRWV
jgi:hypothetical protein